MREFQTTIFEGTQTISGASAAGGASTHEGYEEKLVSHAVRVFLDVTAASGSSPTLAVSLYSVMRDGAEFLIGTFGVKSGISQESLVIPDYARRVRAKWVIGGTTPSFTFSVHSVRL
jgi:hypothetical protein